MYGGDAFPRNRRPHRRRSLVSSTPRRKAAPRKCPRHETLTEHDGKNQCANRAQQMLGDRGSRWHFTKSNMHDQLKLSHGRLYASRSVSRPPRAPLRLDAVAEGPETKPAKNLHHLSPLALLLRGPSVRRLPVALAFASQGPLHTRTGYRVGSAPRVPDPGMRPIRYVSSDFLLSSECVILLVSLTASLRLSARVGHSKPRPVCRPEQRNSIPSVRQVR